MTTEVQTTGLAPRNGTSLFVYAITAHLLFNRSNTPHTHTHTPPPPQPPPQAADDYNAFRDRRSLQDLSRRCHIDRVVVPLIARVVCAATSKESPM
jgi:hypothetical protein